MGIVKAIYDEKELVDKVWYDSSNIYFSKFVENKDDNYGQLYITFTNGSTYVYKHVDMPTDYILFKHGGLDGSQGKTLNKIIKGKYEFEKVMDVDIHDLERELADIFEGEKRKYNVYFISGHRDITEQEFEKYYQPAITDVVENDPDAAFVIGDCVGVDIMAQNYLFDVLMFDPNRIDVFCNSEAEHYINKLATRIHHDFNNHIEGDAAMTSASSHDIAFIRPGKEDSGTAKNIIRRHLMF